MAVVSEERTDDHATLRKLNGVVREFQPRLGITERVSVAIVEQNDFLVSVARAQHAPGGFIIRFERHFLASLDEEEARAVIAHELGHVWIFTNHPYLQTEALANQKALLLVSRESLEKVYEKVWVRQGQKGSLQDFMASSVH